MFDAGNAEMMDMPVPNTTTIKMVEGLKLRFRMDDMIAANNEHALALKKKRGKGASPRMLFPR